jgi:hypothetical protein
MKTSLAVLAMVLSALAGCANVKAYQRGALAHPTMSIEEPVAPAESHVYSVQEGAVGGAGGAGGGCGCN